MAMGMGPMGPMMMGVSPMVIVQQDIGDISP
jgi:hypothetical protein